LRNLQELRHHTLLHDRDHAGWGNWLAGVGADVETFELSRGPVFSQTSLAIDAAVAGQGIALARSALATLDLAAGRLIRPLPDEIAADFAYWIVCPQISTNRISAKQSNIKRFRDWLLQEAAP
jgi:LysR family glycine cleavage system transcriptional activator